MFRASGGSSNNQSDAHQCLNQPKRFIAKPARRMTASRASFT
jgi:hypothetical protein